MRILFAFVFLGTAIFGVVELVALGDEATLRAGCGWWDGYCDPKKVADAALLAWLVLVSSVAAAFCAAAELTKLFKAVPRH